MPARSRRQQRYLAWKFGPAWLRAHHFDNAGRLPERAHDSVQRAITRQRGRKR